ncbi:8776_t:CDS:2, partial [Funneliformis geosporum]
INNTRVAYDEDFTCLKTNDEKFFIHSKKLGIPTEPLDLNEVEKKVYMKDYLYLLVSLFDYPWIWNDNHYAIDSKSENYIFANVSDKLDSSAEVKTNEQSEPSKITPKQNLSNCQLDKGSIIWKIKIEGLDNPKFKTLDKDTIEFIDEISKEKFKTLDKDTMEFIDEKTKENRKTIYKTSIKNYIKKFDLESDEALIEDFIKRLIIIDKESKKEKDYKEKKIINLDINERMTKLEEETIKFEEEVHKNWKNKIEKLMREFTIRMTKIKKLAKDNFQINIAENELRVEKDLIRLFGADKYLRDAKVKKNKYIKIFAFKSLKNNDIFILTEIGIFIFHLIDDNKNLISLNYYHIHLYESDIFIGDENRTSDYDELIYGWMAY